MAWNALFAIPLLASLVLSYRADPGTVYVAADSRLTSTSISSPRPPSDTTCKIRVLHDGVVFVGTGNALFSADRLRTNIYSVAARAAASLPIGPLKPEDIRRIAFAWQATVHARLQAMVEAEGGPANAAIATTGTTGSFFAATGSDEVYGITLRVGGDTDGRLQNIEEPEAQVGYLVATGTNEAKEQALAVAPQYARLPWPGRLEAIEAETIRLQAERYGMRSDIGGPIDLIEITPKGPIWLARKAACR
jgi:hypothetical protein